MTASIHTTRQPTEEHVCRGNETARREGDEEVVCRIHGNAVQVATEGKSEGEASSVGYNAEVNGLSRMENKSALTVFCNDHGEHELSSRSPHEQRLRDGDREYNDWVASISVPFDVKKNEQSTY